MSILDDTEIRELQAAAVSANLSRGALMAGIDGGFVTGLRVEASPADQLLVDLDALNKAAALADGTVPLRIWLANAAHLAGVRREAAIFARVRDRLAAVGGPARELPGSAAPRPEVVDRERLLDTLCGILPAQLETVVFKLAVPTAFLSGATAAQATRSIEILRWADQQGRLGDVARVLGEVTGAGKKAP
jgi:hypothetical protein